MPLSPLLARFSGVRIAVVGDVMIDHHVIGQVGRISDEAPVPVLLVQSERRSLGGAANVAANIAALGGRATLIGLVGDDPAAAQIVQMLDERSAVEPRLSVAKDRPTVAKTRYLGGHQQIVRVDREHAAPAPAYIEDDIIAEIEEAAAGCALFVASDYGKGVLTDRVLAALFAVAKRAAKPVIVDPKRMAFADYRGASVITPNRKELAQAVRMRTETDAEAERAAAAAIAESGAAILLTRSEKGMTLYRAAQPPIHLAAEAREVFDVSGAGDTVVAGLALGLAGGLTDEQAMRIANAAAGVAVGKLGAAIVTREELSDALKGHAAPTAPAAIPAPLEDALRLRAQWRAEGQIVGFTNGCFDLLHAGHVALIRQAADACDRLIVALNADSSVRKLKGPTRPVQTLDARAAVMSALRGVDLVLAFDDDTPLALIETLAPDVLIKGADYSEAEIVGADIVKAKGGRIVLADLTAGQSTSALVEKAKR
ncbi:MAG: D-glycero-beta-D-manno-heptose-7-phosphate kinase [Alphaproteobacteria bacterium]|nr:D-glycero-beta-D-manno-heptose-7-phosphate kinase [Alphaproteobacteria bacterium]